MTSHEQPDIVPLSDEHYMLLVLDLANFRVGEDLPDHVNVNWSRLTTDTSKWTGRWATIRTDPTIEADPAALRFGARARNYIEKFLTYDPKALKALNATATAAAAQVEIRAQFKRRDDGVTEYLYSYAAGTGDGPMGVFLTFLLDPGRRFGVDLRKCQLETCGRFFFVPLGRKGGRIPSFCPGTDHQRKHDALRAPERVAKHREKAAAKRK